MARESPSDKILVQLAVMNEKQTNIIEDISELKVQGAEIKTFVSNLETKQAVLEVKAGLWGTVGGLLATTYTQIKGMFGA